MRRILFVLFLALFLQASDLNQSKVMKYEKMLASLQKIPQDDEVLLQKSLLYKLINLYKTKQNIPLLTPPKNQADYQKLFIEYLDALETIQKIEKTNKDYKDKLSILQKEIASANKSSPHYKTLQLQIDFYQTFITLNNKKIAVLQKNIVRIKDYLLSSIEKIDIKVDEKAFKDMDEQIRKLQTKLQAKNLEKDRLFLLGRNLTQINKDIDYLSKKLQKLYREKLQMSVALFLQHLKNRDAKKVFDIHTALLDLAKRGGYDKDVVNELDNLLHKIETKELGTVKTIKEQTLHSIKIFLFNLWEKLNEPLLSIGETKLSSIKIILALFILILGTWFASFYKRRVKKLAPAEITPERMLFANIGSYLIILISFLISLKILGIDLSSIAIVAGALSVGIGFGLQNIVSNFVSGLILMFERSVKIGDYIELDNGITGHVSDIRMRSTTITTNDNLDIILPNQDLMQNRVINWTMNDKIRRFRIPFGAAYGTDPNRVIKVVKEAVKKSGFTDIYQDQYRHTRVIMTQMGDSSLNFELFVWIEGREILYPHRTISRFLILIYNALQEAGIEIPFPQRDIHIKSIHAPLKIEKNPDQKEN